MKKKKINKTRLKIFIALTLMFTLITTIFIGTKTFAYESINDISDTLDLTTIVDGQYSITSVKTAIGSNNEEYKYIELNHTTTSSMYMSFGINLNSNLSYNYNDTTTYLINYEFGYINSNTNNWTTSVNANNYTSVSLSNNPSGTYMTTQNRTNYYSTSVYGYNYKTAIRNCFDNGTTLNYSNKLYFYFRLPYSVSSTQYSLRIYNIDIVKNSEIYTQSYIDTYYAPLEEQYNQLLENYEQLQDDYSQLSHDYTDLEDNYNELENNYDTLENEYNDLQQDLENLTQTIDNGLWSYTSGVVAFGTGYGASYTSYDDIINANIIKDFTFDCIKTYPTYTEQNNSINGNVYIVMGVLPDENTSNWQEVKYTPANLLNFNINTNITDYIKITIDLTTINNTYQNRILQISKSNIELMNYEITSQKLEGLFDYEASYYRVERIKIEWTKESNNDYLYLVSTNINYTNGYTLGYYDGLNTITYEKDNTINNQQNQINQLNNQINTQQQTINSLNDQIQSFNSDYNLNNLMWTIASTPFESFKQIWNVEFFGVNVSELLLGLITTFIALSIAKRFFF